MVAPTALHRVFNQSLLSRRAMTDDVVLEMYKRSVAVVSDTDPEFEPPYRANPEGLTSFLAEVSSLLEPFGIVIKRTADETSGRPWTALVNAEGAGEIAQQATDLSPLEISFVRAVIAAIVESYPANSVGSRHALGLVKDLNGQMTQTAAQNLLKALVSRGWLATSARGRYSLAPRGLMELSDYLRGEYDDYVQTCKRCNRIVFTGYACANDQCEAHYHGYCYDMITERRAPCMQCKCSFFEIGPTPVGEKAVGRAQDDWSRPQKRRRSGPNGRANNVNGEEEDKEDEDDDLEEEVDRNQSQGASQSLERRAVREEEGDELESENEASLPSRPQSQRRQGETIIPDSFVDPDEEDDDEPPQRRRRSQY